MDESTVRAAIFVLGFIVGVTVFALLMTLAGI